MNPTIKVMIEMESYAGMILSYYHWYFLQRQKERRKGQSKGVV